MVQPSATIQFSCYILLFMFQGWANPPSIKIVIQRTIITFAIISPLQTLMHGRGRICVRNVEGYRTKTTINMSSSFFRAEILFPQMKAAKTTSGYTLLLSCIEIRWVAYDQILWWRCCILHDRDKQVLSYDMGKFNDITPVNKNHSLQ